MRSGSFAIAIVHVPLDTTVKGPCALAAWACNDALESFIPVFVLAAGAAVLFRVHWSRLETPAFLRPLPPPPDISLDA